MSSIAQEKNDTDRKVITIEVNNRPVKMKEHQPTGLEIKEAAIAQGVRIQIDFQLVKKVNERSIPIGDQERVKIKEGDKFRANDGEDNS